jgi:hypothetical protein
MTLLDVEELTRYWIDHPPLHLLAAAYLGVGKGKGGRARPEPLTGENPKKNAGSDLGALLAELGPSFAGGDVHRGLAPVVLDFAELRRRNSPAG